MNVDLAAQKALDRLKRVGFERLSDQDKTLVTVWTFEAHVANRGFAKYLSGPYGDFSRYAPTAFRAIGARQMEAIACEANQVFGPDGPPANREARRAQVEAFSEDTKKKLETLYAHYLHCPDDPDELLELYLKGSR